MIGEKIIDPFRKQGLPPITDEHTRLLILGSLPGDRSITMSQYYGHPRNQFWLLLGAMLDRNLAGLDYAARLAVLRAAGIGLWDVIDTAHRRGSSDAAIRHVQPNDLASFVRGLPRLRAIAFNGAAAARIGTRALGVAAPGIACVTLPSSSPLHAIGLAAKLPAWKGLRTFID